MISNHGYIDGSWKLKIVSEDLNGVVLLTVFNNTVFGEISNRIASHFNLNKNEAKYFSFWCPSKNTWLIKTELTLHQLSLNANTTVLFMKKLRPVHLLLSNKETRRVYVDFSIPSLYVVKSICLELGIPNSYFFSLIKCRRIINTVNGVKQKSFFNKLTKSPLTVSLKNLAMIPSNTKRISKNLGSNCPWTPTSGYGSLSSTINSLDNYRGSFLSINNNGNYNTHLSEPINYRYNNSNANNQYLECNDNLDRSRINKEWIYSSKSFMEQSISETSLLQLRMKSLSFSFDNETITDELLNIYYEYLKNSIVSGIIESDINQILLLGALQYYILLSENETSKRNENKRIKHKRYPVIPLDEEISNILYNLEKELLTNPKETINNDFFFSRIDIFVNLQQILPIKNTCKFRRMKIKLVKEQIRIFKENNFTDPKYEFNIKHCKFHRSFGVNTDENIIVWAFENKGKFVKIETRFYSDEEFITLYACAVSHANSWQPTAVQISDYEESLRIMLRVYRSTEESEFNIFNMPRVELNELIGSQNGKTDSSARYLKTILQYHSSFKNTTVREAKIQFLRFCLNIPRYNYHYFFANILEPVAYVGSTTVAINEEMFMIFDSSCHSIKRQVLPWTTLKSWNINTELNKLELHFQKHVISMTLCDCSVICFHEFISTFIWFASNGKASDKANKFDELLTFINVKT